MKFNYLHSRKSILIILLSFILGACSSGGSSGGGTEPPPPPPPKISIGDLTLDEGDSGVSTASVTISLDKAADGDVNLDYATSNGVAESGDDYTAANGSLTIAQGQTSTSIDIDILGDEQYEQDEQLVVNIFNISAGIDIENDEAFVTIINDDVPALIIEPIYVTENDTDNSVATFNLMLEAVATTDVSMDYETIDGTAESNEDYLSQQGTLTIPQGETSATIDIEIQGDIEEEGSEVFELVLSNLQGESKLETEVVQAFIIDNDSAVTGLQLFGFGANTTELENATAQLEYRIFIDDLSANDITFSYSTADGTATSSEDFTAANGTATIAAGESFTTIVVDVLDDLIEENNETVLLLLSNVPADVNLMTPTVVGTIHDNEPTTSDPPRISITSAAITEGDTGTDPMEFTVSLSEASIEVISVDYASEEVSATENIDYEPVSGSLTFQPGETEKTIIVNIIGDTFTEDDEAFRIRLSNLVGDVDITNLLATGTILTDEPIAQLSLNSLSTQEGNTGTTNLDFTLSLNVATAEDVTVDYFTEDDTATAGEDYVAANGTVLIVAGQTEATISIAINGDLDNENDERFFLNLENLSPNATFLTDNATGTILNDDGTPGWQGVLSLGDASPNSDPSLDMDGTGFGGVIWEGLASSATFLSPIQVSRIENGNWVATETIKEVSSGTDEYPQMLAPGNETLVTHWKDTDNDSQIYQPLTGWQEQTVDPGIAVFNIKSARSENGYAITTWEGADGQYYALFNGQTNQWETAELLDVPGSDTDSRYSEVGMASNGDAVVVWEQNFSDSSLNGIYYIFYDALTGSWSSTEKIPNVAAFPKPESVVMDSNGNVIVFSYGFFEDVMEAHYYNKTNDTWTKSDPTDSTIERTFLPNAAVDQNGNVFVIWIQLQPNETALYDLYVNRFDANTGLWDTPYLLEQSDSSVGLKDRDLAIDSNGNAIVVWVQSLNNIGFPFLDENSSSVRAAFYSQNLNEWSPPEPVNEAELSEYSSVPKVAVNALGNAVVIWLSRVYDASGTSTTELHSNRFIQP